MSEKKKTRNRTTHFRNAIRDTDRQKETVSEIREAELRRLDLSGSRATMLRNSGIDIHCSGD